MKIVLAGQHNSGKSMVFSRLTGIDTIVSNYSGTSVEITRGMMRVNGSSFELLDTPGIYSLAWADGPSDLTRRTITDLGDDDLIINVVDAGSLARNLALTLELLELNLPMIVLLNQVDVAQSNHLVIDHQKLSEYLGVPVIPFSAQTGEGVADLHAAISGGSRIQPGNSPRRVLITTDMAACPCSANCSGCPMGEAVSCSEQQVVDYYQQARCLAKQVILHSDNRPRGLQVLQDFLDKTRMGAVALLLLGLVGFYLLLSFVGWSEDLIVSLFAPIQDLIARIISMIIPSGFWHTILSKGISEGIVVPFSLVMPAMLMVSFLISIIEDIGLLPRYAVLLDRVGNLFGVSGQAVIPLSLGFGCRTPAVVATRILGSEGQRFIVVALLSIVIPCAGTIGMLSSTIVAFDAYIPVIILSMLGVFLLLGWILKKLYGENEDRVYELPSLRMPQAANVAKKIRLRFQGFFTEVLPLLLVLSVVVRIIIESGVLNRLHNLGSLTYTLFGLPPEAVIGVLLTIIQRYLAPLVILNLNLDPRQATIAITMIALSVPCLPVVVMTIREMGVKAVLKIVGVGFAVSLSIGFILNLVLPAIGG